MTPAVPVDTAPLPTHEERAAAFAKAVREWLSDLPADELDELLDGLQADLTERLADGGELGEPAAYAEELRLAAGLPARDETAVRARRRSLRESLRETWIGAADRLRAFWAATPARRSIRDFAISLRPVWWVLRGAAIAWIVLAFFGGVSWSFGVPVPRAEPTTLLVGLLAIVLSVQWGRGAWAPKPWLVWLRRLVSAVAVPVLVFGVPMAWSWAGQAAYTDWGAYEQADPGALLGLAENGEQIENIFAYDCDGRPLGGLQLFDQNGRPITTLQGPVSEGGEPASGWDEETQSNILYMQSALVTMPGTWNVFPMREARLGPSEDWAEAERKAEDPEPPFAEVPPLGSACSGLGDDSAESGTAGGVGGSTGGSAGSSTGSGTATKGE